MKILFVTGGEECECKGSGMIVAGTSTQTNLPIKVICSCVEAREATIETFEARLPQRNIEAGKDEMVPVMVHRVVPREE